MRNRLGTTDITGESERRVRNAVKRIKDLKDAMEMGGWCDGSSESLPEETADKDQCAESFRTLRRVS